MHLDFETKNDFIEFLLSIFRFLTFAVSANSQTVLITGFTPFGGEKIN